MNFKVVLLLLALALAAASAAHVNVNAARHHLRQQHRDVLQLATSSSAGSLLAAGDGAAISLSVAMRLSFDSIGQELRTIGNNFRTKVQSLFPNSLVADARRHVSTFLSKVETSAAHLRRFTSTALASVAPVFSCPLPQRIVEINAVAATKLGFAPLSEPIYCSYRSTVQGMANLLPRITSWDPRFLFGRLETLPSLYTSAALVEVSSSTSTSTSSSTEAAAAVQTGAGAAALAGTNRINCNAAMTAVTVTEGIVAWLDDVLNALDNAITASDPVQIAVCTIAGVAQLIAASLKAVCTEDQNAGQWTQR